MRRDRYIDDEDYHHLALALASLEPCPVYGRVTIDQVMLTLGEAGNIWPQGILRDVIVTATAQAERQKL